MKFEKKSSRTTPSNPWRKSMINLMKPRSTSNATRSASNQSLHSPTLQSHSDMELVLVVQAIISFRSAPRILGLLNREAFLGFTWVPHFTSVINWTLRLGLGLLQQVVPIATPWLAIIDHSIDIGTKKALVVLRVPLAALVIRGSAICLEDCECIGLTINDQINGDTVAADLQTIFMQAGLPTAIIKDGDYTLNKGV